MALKTQNIILRITLWLFMMSSPVFSAYSQDKPIKNLSYDTFCNNAEKVYLLTHSQHLVSGQKLIYTGLVMQAVSQKPSAVSKVLYLELRNTVNATIMRWQSPVQNACFQGSVELPDTLSAGIYVLKAYTNWMANHHPAFVFSTRLLIHPVSEDFPGALSWPLLMPDQQEPFTITLEGSGLWTGRDNQIGVKANDPVLCGESIQVVDDQGFVVTSFKTDEWGYGSFGINPTAGQTYHLKPAGKVNNAVNFQLPQPVNQGVRLSVKDTVNGFFVEVTPLNTSRDLTCLISSHGQAIQTKPILNSTAFLLDNRELPHGILAVEVFDETDKLVAARLILNKADRLPIDTVSVGPDFITWKDTQFSSEQPGTVAAMVTLAEPKNSELARPNIEEYLFFHSELMDGINLPTGEMLNPDRILKSTPYETYFWSRLREHTMTLYRESRTAVISGRISFGESSQSLANQTIYLSSVDTSLAFKYAITDAEGCFTFILDKPWHNRRLIVQTDPVVESDAEVFWHFNLPHEKEVDMLTVPFAVTDDLMTAMKAKSDLHLINTIFKTNQLNNDTLPLSVPIPQWQLFHETPNITVKPVDFEDLDDFSQIAANILPTVRFNKTRKRIDFSIFSPEIKDWLAKSVVFLNGIPFRDLDYIASLGSKDIERIEVFNIPVLYGDLTLSGIMAIYTHRGHIPKSYLEKHTQVKMIEFNPWSVQVSDQPVSANGDQVPDLREVIFFQAFGQMNAGLSIPRATFPEGLLYQIVVEGVSPEGMPISVSRVFNSQFTK